MLEAFIFEVRNSPSAVFRWLSNGAGLERIGAAAEELLPIPAWSATCLRPLSRPELRVRNSPSTVFRWLSNGAGLERIGAAAEELLPIPAWSATYLSQFIHVSHLIQIANHSNWTPCLTLERKGVLLHFTACQPPKETLHRLASRKVFRVLRANKALQRKVLLDDSCSPRRALQLWSRGLFLDTAPKIEKRDIVDTHFHTFAIGAHSWCIRASFPT